MQIDARGDRPDWREVVVIIGMCKRVIGNRKRCAAGSSVDVHVARRVRALTQGARNTGSAFARRLRR
jgi:hypothetical protein